MSEIETFFDNTPAKKPKTDTFYGIKWTWNLSSPAIDYIIVQTTYGKARKYFRPIQYDAKTGKGVQRRLIEKWVRKLKHDMSKGIYSPDSAKATVEQHHYDLGLIEDHHRKVTITGDLNNPISLTDSQHRFAALERIREEGGKMQTKVDQLPITIQVNLNTDPVTDFLNYQKGRPTDKTHVLSMRITKGLVENNKQQIYQDALKIAEILNERDDSPFHNKIQLETGIIAPIPLKSVMAENASDISTSLLAAGRVIQLTKMTVEELSDHIVNAYDLMVKNSPQLFEDEQLLCLPPNGTKGAATIIIGVGILTAYAQHHFDYKDFFGDDNCVSDFLDCCEEVFTRNANNNLSGPAKRGVIGEFAKALFKNSSDDVCHEGIPKELLTLTSTSAYNVSVLPKEKKKTAKKSKKDKPIDTEVEDDVNSTDVDVSDFFETPSEDDGFFDLEQEKLTNEAMGVK